MMNQKIYRYTLLFKTHQVPDGFLEDVELLVDTVHAMLRSYKLTLDDAEEPNGRVMVWVLVFYSTSPASLADCMYEFAHRFPKTEFPPYVHEKYVAIDQEQTFED